MVEHFYAKFGDPIRFLPASLLLDIVWKNRQTDKQTHKRTLTTAGVSNNNRPNIIIDNHGAQQQKDDHTIIESNKIQ